MSKQDNMNQFDTPIEIIDLDSDNRKEPEKEKKLVDKESEIKVKEENKAGKESFSLLNCLCPICSLQ